MNRPPTTAADPALPNLTEDFAATLRHMDVAPHVAIAVSGGGDSVALMHLTSDWAKAASRDPKTIFVLTVDHGLRESAAQEVEQVARWAEALGFEHHGLRWEGAKPKSRLQEKARDARYQLLCGWCADHNVPDLMVGHTSDDQLETVGMRLLKGSGTKGLAGMQAIKMGPRGVRILRPLLQASRTELREVLKSHRASWFEDPSNENLQFERIRMRTALGGDASEALSQGLGHLNTEASAAREALEQATDDLLRDGVDLHEGGWVSIDLAIMRSAPRIIAAHGFSRLIQALGGAPYQPHQSALANLLDAAFGPTFKAATLGGCIIAAHGAGKLVIGREARNITSLALTAGQEALWDHRFNVRVDAAFKRGSIRLCGLKEVNWERFTQQERDLIKETFPVPLRDSALVLAFEDGTFALPHAGIGDWEGVKVVYGAFRPFRPAKRHAL